MPGVSFADDVDVTPDEPLAGVFADWVDQLVRDRSPATVRSYVFDAALVAAILADVTGRAPVAEADLGPAPAPVSEEVWARVTGLVAALRLADLHPRYLEATFNRFATRDDGDDRSRRAGNLRAPATRRRALSSWTSLCEYATRRGLLATNPMRDPRIDRGPRPSHTPTAFAVSEERALFAAIATPDAKVTSRKPWPGRDVALLAVLLTAGTRVSETCNARIGDLQDLDGEPRLRVLGKGNKYRTIPLDHATVEVLRTYLLERRERFSGLGRRTLGPRDPLFVKADGQPFTTRAMQHLVYRWYARAGVIPAGRSCVHALRHSFATHLVDNGASVVELQELLGHASLETTKRYLSAVGDGLRTAVEANPATRLVAELADGAVRTSTRT